MKIIFSRKGFDAGTGKVPSPIFESGEFCSLPILEQAEYVGCRRFSELRFGEHALGQVVHDLTRGKIQPDAPVHLDPDLHAPSVSRQAGWKPVFGQAGAAEGHLQKQGVGEGDIFLFYGWFRRVMLRNRRYCYIPDAPDVHVLFGWLQIERRIPLTQRECIPQWAQEHSHAQRDQQHHYDSIYIAADSLRLPGCVTALPGAGIFRRFCPSLCLTEMEPYVSRRYWRMPKWMYPGEGKQALTYHEDRGWWTLREDGVLLKTVGRGQEFVLDCDEYPEAVAWVADLLSNHT
ncbi:MAG TPA: hypothetical protein VFA41_17570 [Ktedonobacteraceae bacterium]|jgi:hypothetical protein|nr:hypothetical protein [Ktedonobacteraceae bacterium]